MRRTFQTIPLTTSPVVWASAFSKKLNFTLLIVGVVLLVSSTAPALIMTGLGNEPVRDAGWPEGALAVANVKSRVGWWEGPPFGGGQWQFLYRGDTEAFNGTLMALCHIAATNLELALHDGPMDNQFLKETGNTNADTRVHWTFTIWEISKAAERRRSDSPRLDLYLGQGSSVVWSKVRLPWNVTIRDERASAKQPKDQQPVDVINEVGQITLGDGSFYYVFNRDKTFVSRPLGESGRCFDGTWSSQGENPSRLTVTAKIGWMNGFQPPEEYHKIIFAVYPGHLRIPQTRAFSVPNNEQFEGRFQIEEMTKVSKPK